MLPYMFYALVRRNHNEKNTMRIWTLLSQKGGAAKTTTSLNLAVAACEAGEKTLVIDCDPQKSASQWWESREQDDETPNVIANDPADVKATLQQAADLGYTHVIIDTAGYAGLHANQSAYSATLCIVPTQPSIMDMRSTVPTATMLKSIDKRFVFLMTRCPIQGTEVKEATEAFSALGLICPISCMDRKAYKRAYANGLGVTEFENTDKSGAAAAKEIRDVYQWLKNKEDKLKSGPFGSSAATITNTNEAELA